MAPTCTKVVLTRTGVRKEGNTERAARAHEDSRLYLNLSGQRLFLGFRALWVHQGASCSSYGHDDATLEWLSEPRGLGMASASARALCDSIGALAVAANGWLKGERQMFAVLPTLCSATSGSDPPKPSWGAHALSVLSPGGQGDSHFRRLRW